MIHLTQVFKVVPPVYCAVGGGGMRMWLISKTCLTWPLIHAHSQPHTSLLEADRPQEKSGCRSVAGVVRRVLQEGIAAAHSAGCHVAVQPQAAF